MMPIDELVSPLTAMMRDHAGRLALSDGHQTLSYADLDHASAVLADQIAAVPGIVGAALPRGADAIVYTVAALRAGKPFVPVDPGLPSLVRRRLLARLGLAAMLAKTGNEWRLTRLGQGGATVEEDLGYILTSSGTTGDPKLIRGSARGLARYLSWQRTEMAMIPADRSACTAGPWFDFSFKETLAPLGAGGSVHISPQHALSSGAALLRWLAQVRPSMLCMIPSRLAGMSAAMRDTPMPGASDGLRCLLVSGEPFPARLLRQWRQFGNPSAEVFNLYGPTESTVIKLYFRIPADYEPAGPLVPLGGPIPGTRVECTPEICLYGEDFALGYLDESTDGATRFDVANGERALRTGDLGRWDGQGRVVFTGRADLLVKRRGVAVNPSSIEAVAATCPGVDRCAAVATSADIPVVTLYYLGVPSAGALRAHLARLLPAGELPDAVVPVDQFPLTARGKVDRSALLNRPGSQVAACL